MSEHAWEKKEAKLLQFVTVMGDFVSFLRRQL